MPFVKLNNLSLRLAKGVQNNRGVVYNNYLFKYNKFYKFINILCS